eukprot:15128506-Alexandrium_andersonii.AAC.1
MSASLVGSEMCIRDRAHPALRPVLRTGSTGRPLAMTRLRVFLPWTKTVSYTHLTLPTICSV